jgi:hypothetical protein
MREEQKRKQRQANIDRYGSEEAWLKHLRAIASEGGKKTGVKKGFAANPELAEKARLKGLETRRKNKQAKHDQ